MSAWANNAFGNDGTPAYNGDESEWSRLPPKDEKMRKTLTTIRCVPRYGYEYANVRTIDLDLIDASDETELFQALNVWFAQRGIADAVYDLASDDNGFFAVINDEAFQSAWGEAVF
jgi:hypothetical protein